MKINLDKYKSYYFETALKIFNTPSPTGYYREIEGVLASYAKKVEKEDCKLNFALSAKKLDFIIRGVTPIPGAFCYLNGKMLKINKAVPTDKKAEIGKVSAIDEKGEGSFLVGCGEGSLLVTSVIPEGKGKMSAGDFIRGRKIALGDILE